MKPFAFALGFSTLSLVALSPLFAADAPTHPNGPEAARADVGKLETAAGLQATLFASEPMVVNPADMDIDARGRVWVTEGANYRVTPRMKQPWGVLRPGGDRIVILEDTDGDGAADKAKTFYQDPTVNTALGICVLGSRAIVSSSPYVFVLTDTDGDDQADRREVLFEDASQGDHDHGLHAFVFGSDGKLYFNGGNDSPQLRRPVNLKDVPLNGPIPAHDTVPVVDLAGNEINNKGKPYRQGMVFRCNLDGSEVETLGWNFRNNYEVCVDSFGTLWQSDNDDDGNRGVRINYVMEFGNYGYVDELTGAAWGTAWKQAQLKGASEEERPSYHWHLSDPGVVPNLLQTGNGSPTGICLYEGDLLPATFRNQMIHCDAGPRIVRAYPVTRRGAGYSATSVTLLTSSDSWFRPSDVCVAPDGSVFVADWNDAGVGGHNMADRKLATMTGRIYRVAPQGHSYSAPKADVTSVEGAVIALRSPNLAARYLAWTALSKMGDRALPALQKLWQDERNPRLRARAFHLLVRLEGSASAYILALADRDADLRITALRQARNQKLDVIPIVKQLISDASAQVRRECALALRHHKSPEAPGLWAALAKQHDGTDRWYLEALGIGADRQEDAFFSAWLQSVGDQWNTPAGRDIIWRSRCAKAAPLLAKIATDKNVPERDKRRYIRALDFIQGAEKEQALLDIATATLQ